MFIAGGVLERYRSGMGMTEDIQEPGETRVEGPSRSRQVGPPNRSRWLGLLAMAIGGTLLAVAASLSPAEEGIGTHQAMGLPACNWITTMDLPCPTCGMTTAFSHTVRGEWLSAFRAQPLGLVFCMVAAMAVVGGLWSFATGGSPGRLVATAWNRWWTWGLILMALAAWGWKIAVHRGVF